MIFFWKRLNGRWMPQKASAEPRIPKEEKRFYKPWSDQGLGIRLTEDDELLSLDELARRYAA